LLILLPPVDLAGYELVQVTESSDAEPLQCPIVDRGPGWTGRRILGLFEHGEGTGTRDNDIERFMNEIQGVRIILDQLAADGLELQSPGPRIPTIGFAYEERRYLDRSKDPSLPLHTTEILWEALHLDGYDPVSGVAFKLIDHDMYWGWSREAGLRHPSENVYDLPALARWLTERIEQDPKIPIRHVVFFYDPAIAPQARVVKPGDDRLWLAPNQEAERLLRAQVDHFVACWRTLQ